jgi:hypothetical protein
LLHHTAQDKAALGSPFESRDQAGAVRQGPGQNPAARAAEWSAQELLKVDEELRHVDEAIHKADREK